MTLTIALPVLNEEAVLRQTVGAVRAATAALDGGWKVSMVIADNGSQDATASIGQELAGAHADVRYLRVPARGKGLAIRTAWDAHPADALAFMDADLATNLGALPSLLAALASAHLAVGSRYLAASKVDRPLSRSVLSHGYRVAMRAALKLPVADAPCGFKAIRGDVWPQLAPSVRNDAWFFDTELLAAAHRAGFLIAEVPVIWTDGGPYGRPSRAVPWQVVREYARELRRLRVAA
jgi:glycosyltransferase involved in cell wall biosynthesis